MLFLRNLFHFYQVKDRSVPIVPDYDIGYILFVTSITISIIEVFCHQLTIIQLEISKL